MWMDALTQVKNEIAQMDKQVTSLKGKQEFLKGMAQVQVENAKQQISHTGIANEGKIDQIQTKIEKSGKKMIQLV
jgi:competence protein ComGF